MMVWQVAITWLHSR